RMCSFTEPRRSGLSGWPAPISCRRQSPCVMYAVVIASPAEAPPGSLSEHRADGQRRLGSELRGGNLLAVLISHLEYLDLAALRRDGLTLGTDGRHRSDAARHLREPA